ncbi:MAG: L-sorbosone dehydrogenase, partial [uncultured Gemmatimonadaceae bacterium]
DPLRVPGPRARRRGVQRRQPAGRGGGGAAARRRAARPRAGWAAGRAGRVQGGLLGPTRRTARDDPRPRRRGVREPAGGRAGDAPRRHQRRRGGRQRARGGARTRRAVRDGVPRRRAVRGEHRGGGAGGARRRRARGGGAADGGDVQRGRGALVAEPRVRARRRDVRVDRVHLQRVRGAERRPGDGDALRAGRGRRAGVRARAAQRRGARRAPRHRGAVGVAARARQHPPRPPRPPARGDQHPARRRRLRLAVLPLRPGAESRVRRRGPLRRDDPARAQDAGALGADDARLFGPGHQLPGRVPGRRARGVPRIVEPRHPHGRQGGARARAGGAARGLRGLRHRVADRRRQPVGAPGGGGGRGRRLGARLGRCRRRDLPRAPV